MKVKTQQNLFARL